jgi:predicted ATPase/DNA-binding winged helix-turn-helix (wHTH) protein
MDATGEEDGIAYRFGEFLLVPSERRLYRNGIEVKLGQRPFGILQFLVERPGIILSQKQIIDGAASRISIASHTLSGHIGELRTAVGADAIVTINSQGYQFRAKVEKTRSFALPPPSVGNPRRIIALPQRRGRLVGRTADLASLEDRLGHSRLVTVAGPSGVGKTEIAIELGWRALDRFPNGVALVDLAPLSEGEAIPPSAATALGVPLHGGEALAAIASAIRDHRLLLILDNCEHLATATAAFAHALLDRAPNLSVLATSQHVFRGGLEQIYQFSGLTLPDEDEADPARLAATGSGELFAAAAQAADRRFALNAANAAGIAEICRRLDGLPLPLRMAAARVPLLGVEGVRVQLGNMLRLLRQGAGTAARRHLTLREMVEWSYGLLDAAEAQLFCRLGAFPASFSVADAVAVTDTDEADAIDLLFGLLNKSFLMVEEGEPPRYRLWATHRVYALEKLAQSGERDELAKRHARHVKAIFDRAEAAWETMPDADWRRTYAPYIDDVRAALDWALAAPERTGLGIALAGASARLWNMVVLVPLGQEYCRRFIDLIDKAETPSDAARLLRYAGLLWRNSDRLHGVELLERSAAMYREMVDEPGLGATLGLLGGSCMYLGQYAEAEAMLHEADRILAGRDRVKSFQNVINASGSLALAMSDADAARRFYAIASDLARKLTDKVRESISLINLGEIEFRLGSIEQAIDLAEEAAACVRDIPLASSAGPILVNLATYRLFHDELDEARAHATTALALLKATGGHWLRLCLQVFALIGALEERYIEAAKVIGWIDAEYDRTGEPREGTEQRIYDRALSLLTANRRTEDIELWIAEGTRWDEERALDYALRRLVPPKTA